MFTTNCPACGMVVDFEEGRIPPSGLITTCPHCRSEITVVPPGMGSVAETSDPRDIIDLPAPKGTVTRDADLPDLLTPVGPTPRGKDLPDLLTPVGPTSRRKQTEVASPVPAVKPAAAAPPARGVTPPIPSVRGTTDLLAPVGPRPIRNAPDLLQPVGPAPTKAVPDLLAPVGPQPVRNAPDLLQPVGPVPTKGVPDLLAPVGPQPVRNAPDLVQPVGPKQTKGLDLPAPKGFFDEAPPPRPGRAGPIADDNLDDDLAVVPAGLAAPIVEDIVDHSKVGPRPSTPFSADDLEIPHGAPAPTPPAAEVDTGMAYGEVDLPKAPDDATIGLVSFSAPTGKAATQQRGIELAEAPRKKTGTIAGVTEAAERKLAAKKRRRASLAAALLAVLALGAGAYYVYFNVEWTLGGFMTVPARERQEAIARGQASARSLMTVSDAGHWYRAATAAEKVIGIGPKLPEPRALAAQAYLAATIDEGRHAKIDRDKADALIGDLLKLGGKGPQVDKALSLRSILNPGKAGEAYAALARLAVDPDVPLFMGWAALEAKSYDKARDAFATALRLVPDRQPALLGLGRAQAALGDREHARETFQKVFDKYPQHKNYGAWLGLTELTTTPRDPTGRREKELAVLCESAPERETAHPRDRARALTLFGDEAMAAGRFAQAAERYRQARDLDDRELDALVGGALATVEMRSHAQAAATLTLTDARRALEQALVLDPRHVGALIGLTRINLLEGRAGDAQKTIAAALAVGDKDALVHYWNGKVLEDPLVNASADAEKAYQRAIELAPDDYRAYVALSQLYLGKGQAADKMGKKPEAKAYVEKAVQVLAPIAEAAKSDPLMANILGEAYLGAKDAAHAEQWFRLALAGNASFVDARQNLAATLEAEGKLPEAIAEYGKAYQQAPRREDIALSLALALERSRDYPAADKIYSALLSTAGGSVPTARALAAAGRYHARRGEIERARKEGEALAAIEPANPATLFLAALGLATDGNLNDAHKILQDAVAMDPQAQYWELIGRILTQNKTLGDPMAAFQQAIKLDATYAPAFIGMGRWRLLRAEYTLAIDALEQAARLDPVSDEIWVGIGDAKFELHKLPEAVAAYQQALARNDKRAYTYFKLAKAYDQEGQGGEAVNRYRQALAFARTEDWRPEAWRLLGQRYHQNGDHGGMCAAFEQYLALAPPNDLLRRSIQQEHASCPAH
jgi:tetratricopeptide (TPR) repeat protein